MKKELEQVKKAFAARLAGIKPVEAFKVSEETMKLLVSDPAKGAGIIAEEKAAYDAINTVSPLRVVLFNGVAGVLSCAESEDEAKAVCRSALAGWYASKGLRSLTAAQVERAASGKQEDGDIALADIHAIATAFMSKEKDGKSVSDLIKGFSLADTSRAVFNNNQDALRKVAALVLPVATPAS